MNERLVEDFPAAIREHQFLVYYQPKFDIRTEEPYLVSAEALVRWNHPTLGMIAPSDFIPLFEENGLVRELDHYVWEETAKTIGTWKRKHGISVPVSINVSRVDMDDPDLIKTMKDLVEKNGLEYRELLLEITESAYTDNSEQIIDTVKRLRSEGFRIEMDDFGTGYSSLNMITTLPIDALKLDMQFLRNTFMDRKDTRLLETVIQLADVLEVPTIAEGVETAEQLLTLRSSGCDIAQGYFFAKPLPADEFEEFLLNIKRSETEVRKEGHARPSDQFAYNALHDPLTGLYNHSAFDVLFRDADKDHIAVLVAEVDDYAQIKERDGLKTAEQVIRRAAEALRVSFRSVDHVCRLREDEFAVIMARANSSMRDLVLNKADHVNELLAGESEGVPGISLSVGVAFSDRENPQGDVYEDAVSALAQLKEAQGRGCRIY